MSHVFYLGMHQPSSALKLDIPVFISMSRLLHRKKNLSHPFFIMDSGGFTMISKYGKYIVSESEYISCIEKHSPLYAFCQDWMCESFILKKTGFSVRKHQQLTCDSYLSLSSKSSKVLPVLQGWNLQDYLDHMHMYLDNGVGFSKLFGLGSVCSRNSSPSLIASLIYGIKSRFPEIKLHGFGIKSQALSIAYEMLESSDSMAWSYSGRKTNNICPDCLKSNCGNCTVFAIKWRSKLLSSFQSRSDFLPFFSTAAKADTKLN